MAIKSFNRTVEAINVLLDKLDGLPVAPMAKKGTILNPSYLPEDATEGDVYLVLYSDSENAQTANSLYYKTASNWEIIATKGYTPYEIDTMLSSIAAADIAMTGYEKSSSSDPLPIATTDTASEAIGKLEQQAGLNKNNISINRSEIADIIDNGAKNIAIIANVSQSNMTATVQSDGYKIAITGNNQTGNKTITWGNFTVSKTGNYAVDYEITGTGGSFFIVDETTGTSVREYYPEHTSYYVESLTAGHNYSIRTYRNGAIDSTISLLICNESARIISDKKVPYCPSLAELYALVKSYHSGS